MPGDEYTEAELIRQDMRKHSDAWLRTRRQRLHEDKLMDGTLEDSAQIDTLISMINAELRGRGRRKMKLDRFLIAGMIAGGSLGLMLAILCFGTSGPPLCQDRSVLVSPTGYTPLADRTCKGGRATVEAVADGYLLYTCTCTSEAKDDNR
jgi:hypothetical protein